MGVFFSQFEQQAHGAQVGANLEQVLRRNLASHDALGDGVVGERGNHPGKLADFDPDNLVHQTRKFGMGLVFESDRDQPLDPQGTGLPSQQHW